MPPTPTVKSKDVQELRPDFPQGFHKHVHSQHEPLGQPRQELQKRERDHYRQGQSSLFPSPAKLTLGRENTAGR